MCSPAPAASNRMEHIKERKREAKTKKREREEMRVSEWVECEVRDRCSADYTKKTQRVECEQKKKKKRVKAGEK